MAKYFNIAEVSELLKISKANLRYLETTIKKVRIKKIRGRRYYTESNIEQLKTKLEEKGFEVGQLELFKPAPEIKLEVPHEVPMSPSAPLNDGKVQSALPNPIIDQIENLEKKLRALQDRLQAA